MIHIRPRVVQEANYENVGRRGMFGDFDQPPERVLCFCTRSTGANGQSGVSFGNDAPGLPWSRNRRQATRRVHLSRELNRGPQRRCACNGTNGWSDGVARDQLPCRAEAASANGAGRSRVPKMGGGDLSSAFRS